MDRNAALEVEASSGAGEVALRQVAEAVGKVLRRDFEVSSEGKSFRSRNRTGGAGGILSFSGVLVEGSVVEVRVELARVSAQARGSYVRLFEKLSGLDEKAWIVEPTGCGPDRFSLAVELRTRASPLSPQREAVLHGVLTKLEALARQVQDELPAAPPHAALEKLYKGVAKAITPVYPVTDGEFCAESHRSRWASKVHEYLKSGSSVAITALSSIERDFALALLAHAGPTFGTTIGRVTLPALNAKGLLELARTAPGTLAVPAMQISVASNVYELSSEIHTLLAALSQAGSAVLFVGSLDELRRVFSGGQGSRHSPINPVVMYPPEVALADYVTFAIREAARAVGGLSEAQTAEAIENVGNALGAHPVARQLELLPWLASRTANAAATGRSITLEATRAFAACVDGLSETLGGVSSGSRVERSAEIQRRSLRTLSDPALLDFLRSHLLGQDRALEELVERLRTEALTRPLHQPLRYCAQGTPGNGKSESARLLAERLGVPFVTVDAASMSDFHTASAQLLGSGRGIVGSYEAGRLEQAAKHHAGAVVEVSDLDHAAPPVRAHLADLFLQALENGEIQTATGAMVSCANLLFAFTMNLPAGSDERVRRSLGFGDQPSHREVGRRVIGEIKEMLSSAFLSRVGTPILFDPLEGGVLVQIAERAVEAALASALPRLEIEAGEIIVDSAVGEAVVEALEVNLTSFGVRALVERARSLSASAVLALERRGVSVAGKRVKVLPGEAGTLALEVE